LSQEFGEAFLSWVSLLHFVDEFFDDRFGYWIVLFTVNRDLIADVVVLVIVLDVDGRFGFLERADFTFEFWRCACRARRVLAGGAKCRG